MLSSEKEFWKSVHKHRSHYPTYFQLRNPTTRFVHIFAVYIVRRNDSQILGFWKITLLMAEPSRQ